MHQPSILEDIPAITSQSVEEIYGHILRVIRERKKFLLYPVNIHTLRVLHGDVTVKDVFKKADTLFPDGVIVTWLWQLLGNPSKGRVSGTDLTHKLLNTPGIRIYIIGTTPDILRMIARKFSGKHSATISGTYSPPFNENGPEYTEREIRTLIVTAKPDVILVALGQPKQEIWLSRNFHKTGVPVALSVGSALDILSGKIPRAPSLMKTYGLEWAWRIICEPKRLVKRYLDDFGYLLRLIFYLVRHRVAGF